MAFHSPSECSSLGSVALAYTPFSGVRTGPAFFDSAFPNPAFPDSPQPSLDPPDSLSRVPHPCSLVGTPFRVRLLSEHRSSQSSFLRATQSSPPPCSSPDPLTHSVSLIISQNPSPFPQSLKTAFPRVLVPGMDLG